MGTKLKMATLVVLFALGLNSCIEKTGERSRDKTTGNKSETISDAKDFLMDSEMKKEVFYGLYSPVEISKMIQGEEVHYTRDWFLPVSKANDFLNSPEIALALGVYGADFSMAKMFNSTQDALNYLEVISELSEKLGIPGQLIYESAERLEENANNLEALTEIAFETFEKSNSYLYENERESTANLILLGGWIEGLYQVTNNLYSADTLNPRIVELVVDQKYSLNFLMSVLKNYYEDPYVAYYFRMLQVLQKYLDKVEFYYKEGQVRVDKVF